MEFIAHHEAEVRLTVFLVVLSVMISAEAAWPRRARVQERASRWPINFAFMIIASIILRLAAPVLSVAAAVLAAERGWGLLNALDLPVWAEVALALVVLDLALYGQHRAMHAVPVLWRIHKVHHTDLDLDATSGVRFHPVEYVLSALYKVVIVLFLGPMAAAVILFEIALNGFAVFNHANLRLPRWVDAPLRLLFVTPDMHVVHHSITGDETNRNFGFCLTLWDRLFASYQGQPALGHGAIEIGVVGWRDPAGVTFKSLMTTPFTVLRPEETYRPGETPAGKAS